MRAFALIEVVLSQSFRRVIESESLLRATDEPEAIHQARVATLRLRSELQTFRKALDRSWVRTLRERLQRLSTELSRVRDTDVLFERLEAGSAHLAAPDRPRTQTVLEICKQAQADARMRLQTMPQETWYVELIEQLRNDAPREHIRVGKKKRARPFVRSLVKKKMRELRAAVRRCDKDPSDEQLHRIRIRTKHLRYLTEATAFLFGKKLRLGKKLRRLIKRATKLQTILGINHDAEVAYEKLRQLAQIAESMGSPEIIFAAGELAALQIQTATTARKKWPKAWRKIRCW